MHLTKHHKMESASMLPRMIPTITGHLLQKPVSRAHRIKPCPWYPTNKSSTCSCPTKTMSPVCHWGLNRCPTCWCFPSLSEAIWYWYNSSFEYRELRLFTYPYFRQVMRCRPVTRSPDVVNAMLVPPKFGLVDSSIRLPGIVWHCFLCRNSNLQSQKQRKQNDIHYSDISPDKRNTQCNEAFTVRRAACPAFRDAYHWWQSRASANLKRCCGLELHFCRPSPTKRCRSYTAENKACETNDMCMKIVDLVVRKGNVRYVS